MMPLPIYVVYSESQFFLDHCGIRCNVDSFIKKYLDDDERNRYFSIKNTARRKQFLHGRYLLKNLIAQYLSLSVEEVLFSYTRNKKPYLALAQDVHFSLTHCDTMIAAAVGESSLGIDLERIPNNKAIHPDLFPVSIREYILQSKNSDIAFAACWTAIESLVKLRDSSIFTLRKALNVEPLNDNSLLVNMSEFIQVYDLQDHMLALAATKKNTPIHLLGLENNATLEQENIFNLCKNISSTEPALRLMPNIDRVNKNK